MPSLDPSRPLSCIPLRASLRRLCAQRHEDAAREARAQAEHNRTIRVSGGDEEHQTYWSDLFATSAREADARAAACDAMAARWLA